VKSGRRTASIWQNTYHDMSPELVTIWLSSRKRQQDK